eukprot:PhF_6_TR20138/c0_g1_i1/m.29267/K03283/HSPA1s; heat shock 70kDa protein 1/2/6/8
MNSREIYMGSIGIDFGTAYSSVSVWHKNRVVIIPNDQGNYRTPSYVAFKGTERSAGDSAKWEAAMDPTNVVFDTKTLIGAKFSETVRKRHWPFNIKSQDDHQPVIEVAGGIFSPEKITSIIFLKLKAMAEQFLGKEVKKAVVTVPSYFNQLQRQATRDAGALAGLEVLRVLNDHSAAAAFACVSRIPEWKDCHVLFLDLRLLTKNSSKSLPQQGTRSSGVKTSTTSW